MGQPVSARSASVFPWSLGHLSRFCLALALGMWPLVTPASAAFADAPCNPCYGTAVNGDTTYRTVSFTQVGTWAWTVPAGVPEVNVLVVGGGGGGGKAVGLLTGYGGGGGGGQVKQVTPTGVANTVLSITVGGGGSPSSNGNPSSVTVGSTTTQAAGGSRGEDDTGFFQSGSGGASGSGRAGGSPNFDLSAGGGGGESGVGGNATGNDGGAGGSGVSIDFFGIVGDFGGGGGGGAFGAPGAGGAGGGSGGSSGASNSGGGGGGATSVRSDGSPGGSGTVIASYPLIAPSLSLAESTADGFTVGILNYTPADTWSISPSAGTANVDGLTGRITVSGLLPAQAATLTIVVDQDVTDGLAGLSGTISGTALSAALTPTLGLPVPEQEGFRVPVTNYDSSFSWAATTTAGTVSVSGATGEIVVRGLAPLQPATVTLTTEKANHVDGRATVASQALGASFIPRYGQATPQPNGFTIAADQFNPLFVASLEQADARLSIDPTSGLLTATGLDDGEEVTATVVTRRVGYLEGRVTVTGQSLLAALIPRLNSPVPADDGFAVRVANYDPSFTWRVTSTSGSANLNTTGLITVGGLEPGESSTVTVQTSRPDSREGSAAVTGTAIALPPSTSADSGPSNDLGPVVDTFLGTLSLVNIFADQGPIGPILDVSVDLSVGSLVSGKAVTVSASRLEPGSEVTITIYSTPTEVGRATVDANGAVTFSGSVPGTLPPGIHTLDVRGTGEGGQPGQSAGIFEVDDQGLIVRAVDPAQTTDIVEPGGPELLRALEAGAPLYDPTRFPAETAALAVAAAASVAAIGAAARAGGSSGSSSSSSTANQDGAELEAVYDEDLAVEEEPEEGRGDRSRTWRHRHTATLDRWVVATGSATGSWVRLPARLLRESTWSRALFGSGAAVLWMMGIVLGFFWGVSTSWLALPPSFALLAAVVLLGIADALAGALAWVVLFSGALVTGSLTTVADGRTVMGLFVISIAPPLIASATRPLRRVFSGESTDLFDRIADYVVSSVVVVVAGSAMYLGLNGMAGLEVVSEELLPLFQVLLVVGVVSRSLVEDIATHLYPLRTHQLSQVEFPTPGKTLSVLSVLSRAGAFVFVASSFLGWDIKLLIIVALFALPLLLMIWYDELPNSEFLFRYLPRGMAYWLVLTLIGIVTAAWILGRVNPGGDVILEYAIFFLPWAIIDAAFAFGKDGNDWPDGWLKRLVGIPVVGYTTALLMGWVSLLGQ